MSGILARGTKLGMSGRETTMGQYVVPAISVPWNTAKFNDDITPLRDESVRSNDAVVQGIQQGIWSTTWDIACNFYSDLAGHLLRAMIGPDTVTAGTAVALLSSCTAGAPSLTLSAGMTSPNIIQISDAGGANLEWVAVTVAGTTATVTTPGGTKFAHSTGASVISQSTHVFKQNRPFGTQWPSYSFTTDTGAEQLAWPGCVMSELGIKIDPKGLIEMSPKYMGFPSTTNGGTVTTFSYAASAVQPAVGWGWTVTNAGASSTRGLTMDITLKRPCEVIPGSDGTQGPREIFAGAMEIDGSYKTLFENLTDKNLFIANNQLPTTHTITKPVQAGGESLAIVMSQSAYTTGDVDTSPSFLQLTQNVTGIQNATDGGITAVTLKNYQSAQY